MSDRALWTLRVDLDNLTLADLRRLIAMTDKLDASTPVLPAFGENDPIHTVGLEISYFPEDQSN
jgi:hypothetical protein